MENDSLVESSEGFFSRTVRSVGGDLSVPGDKSISHRALLLSAIAEGKSNLRGFLDSDDCLATMAALRSMGVHITLENTDVSIVGVGLQGLTEPTEHLDLGNSGTAMRLLAGMLSAQSFSSVLTGDVSLRGRPMKRVTEPLGLMGGIINTVDGLPPLRIQGKNNMIGIDYTLPIASAQVKSALLIAGLWAKGRTTVRSPGPSRDHTERMLATMGVNILNGSRQVVSLDGPASLQSRDQDIPGDFSSAAFFIVAGLLSANEGLLIRNVGINPTRTGLLTILKKMGGSIDLLNRREFGTEPVADIFVKKSKLKGIKIETNLVPLAIDEFPVLFVAAAHADGYTTVAGAQELRYKESDRLHVMSKGLQEIGIKTKETDDGLIILGGASHGGCVDSYGDHRIAMSFAVAGMVSKDVIQIKRTDEVSTSFPNFLSLANSTGLAIESYVATKPLEG